MVFEIYTRTDTYSKEVTYARGHRERSPLQSVHRATGGPSIPSTSKILPTSFLHRQIPRVEQRKDRDREKQERRAIHYDGMELRLKIG